MKIVSLILLILLFNISYLSLKSQTVFSYGDYRVEKEEFLRALNKNSNGEKPDEKAYRDYLDLYIRFKLKVQAAYDRKMDTLPHQQAEWQNFRNQLATGFMNDDPTVKALVDEAFERSQKEIKIAHIYIPFNGGDTSASLNAANEAYGKLVKGKDFGELVKRYSSDSSSFERKGEIGYIKVFVLPYPLENLAYTLAPGEYSKPFRTQAGYHIFKNTGERKALGQIELAQIFLLFTPGSDAKSRNTVKDRADSIYKALKQGASFDSMAVKFSNDNLSYESGGRLPAFSSGTYDPLFEEAAFALKQDGEISLPVLTAEGYHILKRIKRIPVNNNKENAEQIALLRQQVLEDARMDIARKAMVKKAYALTGLDPASYDEQALMNYYKDHLEEYNTDFAIQMKEFKDGNLLFEIMQTDIWDKAGNDTTGLFGFYELNKEKYFWEPSADVILFLCHDKEKATAIRTAFSINTAGWRDILKQYEEIAQADSGRYELNLLPVQNPSSLKQGMITPVVSDSSDNTSSFVYIRKLYPARAPRTFEDAKGFVLNDYQNFLEEKWMEELKKKYPVKVDESFFKTLF